MWYKAKHTSHFSFFSPSSTPYQYEYGTWLCSSCMGTLSHVQLFATPWTVAHQAPLSMEFSREEYWSGLPCLPPGDLPDPWVKESCVSCIDRQILYQLCHMWNMALFLNYKQKCCILQKVPVSIADITGGLGTVSMEHLLSKFSPAFSS